jgi:hypothetical protein
LRILEKESYYWTTKGTANLDKLQGEPCTTEAYWLADEAINAKDELAGICRQIDELVGSSLDCDYDKGILEERIEKEFKDLLERCPPAPIIKTIETEYTGYLLPYHLQDMENVCEAIGNQACLDDIKAAIARDKAGVKPLALPLEV